MSDAIEFTQDSFDGEISSGITLVDFWAPWCGPCRMVSPTVDEIAKQYKDKVKVGKVNVDENQELAVRFGVRSIPTILIFKDGEQIDSLVGVQAKAVFEQKLNSLL
ncbi:MAG: thioredoxin [Helicobacteraceae bacterium]|jgi:thioredoxin 1|nr:thioredoxin [Helicobacteraceae bacterium]